MVAKRRHHKRKRHSAAHHSVKRRRGVRHHGRGKVGDWFKGAFNKVKNFLQQSKILSTIAPAMSLIPGVGPGVAAGVTSGLKMAGLGKRRRLKRVRHARRGHSRHRKHHGHGMYGSGMGIAPQPVSMTYPHSTSFAMPRF